MKHRKVGLVLAALLLSGCGQREQISIERNVQESPAPDIEATVKPDEQPTTLAEELAAKREAGQAKMPEDVKQAMAEAQQKLDESGILDKALKVGDPIPEFSLQSAAGETVTSAELLAKGPAVITFYRGGWCPYCNLTLQSLQKSNSAIVGAGATLVAIAPETTAKAKQTSDKGSLSYLVLSDPGNQVAEKFGIVFTLDPALQERYKGFGADLAEYNGDESWTLPLPATYVVDPQGKVVWRFVDTDYTKRAEPADIVAAVDGIIASDQVNESNLDQPLIGGQSGTTAEAEGQ